MDDGRFNLSAAALKHRELTLFFLLAIAIGGVLAFFELGQREDPDFTFRAIVVRTLWPGATAAQVDQQVTDRIEKKLQEVPYFKWTRSYSKPGESLIILELLDTAPPKDVPGIWYQVRKKIGDIRQTLPPESLGPFFNDEFGDVFGSIYAFTADGFTHSELREHVERVRQELLRLPNVSKIELVGVQDDRIYVELSTHKLASLGIDPQAIAQALAAQNAVASPGSVETLAGIRGALPPGYRIEAGGAFEENLKAQSSIAAGMPLVVAVILAMLMIQLKSFSHTFMVVLTAPLGIVGVAFALLVFGQPFGFVAMLGTIALAGMIMRNSVILVDQIEQDIQAGHPVWTAIREASVRRFRPIVLTAAAAMLAMIPLTRSVLWGPMAYAIMGGLIVATVLTILFVPALYAAWFRVKRP